MFDQKFQFDSDYDAISNAKREMPVELEKIGVKPIMQS